MSIWEVIADGNEVIRTFDCMYDEKARRWFCVLTVGSQERPEWSVTVSYASLIEACRVAERAAFMVENDFVKGQLVLPDMGDFQVKYFPKQD